MKHATAKPTPPPQRPDKNGRKKTAGSVAKRIVGRLTEFTAALESGTDISDKFTLHKVRLQLEPGHYKPQTVRATRELLNLSQRLFAKFLGVSVQTVRAWEQGYNVPSEMACRFLDEIRLNPPYWKHRLQSATVSTAAKGN